MFMHYVAKDITENTAIMGKVGFKKMLQNPKIMKSHGMGYF